MCMQIYSNSLVQIDKAGQSDMVERIFSTRGFHAPNLITAVRRDEKKTAIKRVYFSSALKVKNEVVNFQHLEKT